MRFCQTVRHKSALAKQAEGLRTRRAWQERVRQHLLATLACFFDASQSDQHVGVRKTERQLRTFACKLNGVGKVCRGHSERALGGGRTAGTGHHLDSQRVAEQRRFVGVLRGLRVGRPGRDEEPEGSGMKLLL